MTIPPFLFLINYIQKIEMQLKYWNVLVQPVHCKWRVILGANKLDFFFFFPLFLLKRHGKRFAHWTKEARCLCERTVRPLYRGFPGLTHDLSQHVVAKSNRISSSHALVDFIVANKGTDYHIQVCASRVHFKPIACLIYERLAETYMEMFLMPFSILSTHHQRPK